MLRWFGIVGLLLIVAAPSIAFGKSKHRKEEASTEAAPPAPPSPEPVAAAPEPAAPAVAPAPPAAVDPFSFGPPGPGTGSVTIKGDNIQVTFDGRSFGASPVTIHDVPKGDYIVEGNAPDGRYVSRPVTVEENSAATVDLQAALPPVADHTTSDRANAPFRLPLASKILLGVGVGALTVGAVYGVLEMKAHSDYESATTQSALDAAGRAGQRDALLANAGFLTSAASVVAAGLVALPAFLRSEHPTSVPSAVVLTNGTQVVALAGVSVVF
jgi:hypothetical protein